MCIGLGLRNFELSLETANNFISLRFPMFTIANYLPKWCGLPIAVSLFLFSSPFGSNQERVRSVLSLRLFT